ncbi:unnamed protein product, partial [Thlaspi arvense]
MLDAASRALIRELGLSVFEFSSWQPPESGSSSAEFGARMGHVPHYLQHEMYVLSAKNKRVSIQLLRGDTIHDKFIRFEELLFLILALALLELPLIWVQFYQVL